MHHFRQLRDEATGTFSYLVGCARTGTALLIDPVANQTPLYLGITAELGLRLEWVLETHLHADHITAADSLREWTHARVAVGDRSGIRAADRLLVDEDEIACGDLHLRVLATPGHTPGCISFLWEDRLFSGDSLLIGSCGRTDEPGSDGARLYDSVVRRLFVLPGETLVYPGHCLSGRRVSSIGEERESNPLFQDASRDSFAMLKSNQALPVILPIALEANRHCGRLMKTDQTGRRRAPSRLQPCATTTDSATRLTQH
jgi:glyoxylase-like metal-dependent hydrolase (beta-lactamase superfamily II)